MGVNRREGIRKTLHALYLPIYDAICEELHSGWQPYFGLRSFAEQAALYSRGRTQPGKIVTYAPPGASPHNYGMASDWTLWEEGKPIWLKKEDPRWREYEIACVRSGANWGGFFVSLTDYYHNELPLKVSWRSVKKVYDKSGMDEALRFIETNREGA